jgi:hypothetical protein
VLRQPVQAQPAEKWRLARGWSSFFCPTFFCLPFGFPVLPMCPGLSFAPRIEFDDARVMSQAGNPNKKLRWQSGFADNSKPCDAMVCALISGFYGGGQMLFERLAEEKIKEAIDNGEFDNLSGQGKPIDLEAYFATPAELRLGYSVLKSAGCVPEEVALLKEIESLKDRLSRCLREDESERLRQEIDGKTLKLNLLADSNRRRKNSNSSSL